MNLVLGTAQFGLDYGVTNKEGKVSFNSVLEMLQYCKERGVYKLDTASSYGDSELVIGNALKELGLEKNFKITSKIYLTEEQSLEDVERIFEMSLENLKGAEIEQFLVHQGSQLIQFGEPLAEKLEELKKKYSIKRIGVSVYSIKELETCFDLMKINSIQAPYNILNQSFKKYAEGNKVKFNNVDIYLRSLFLQGILLAIATERPTFFDSFKDILEKYDTFVEASNISRLGVLLAASKSFSSAKGIVFGCTNLRELKEIIDLWNTVDTFQSEKIEGLASDNEELLNPSLWRI